MSDHDRDQFDDLRVTPRDSRGDKFVDKLLDAGLARYSATEPRPGLEQRLLAGLRAAARPSRWLDWRWVGALATAAVAVAVLAVFFLRQQPLPEPPPPAVANAPAPVPVPTAAPSPEAVQPSRMAKATVRRTTPNVEQARAEAPRLETFPAPAPLSEQERLLLLFARQAPQEAVLMAQARNRPTEPLGIAPLQPIEGLVKKKEENNN